MKVRSTLTTLGVGVAIGGCADNTTGLLIGVGLALAPWAVLAGLHIETFVERAIVAMLVETRRAPEPPLVPLRVESTKSGGYGLWSIHTQDRPHEFYLSTDLFIHELQRGGVVRRASSSARPSRTKLGALDVDRRRSC